jgi:hypothetical protein
MLVVVVSGHCPLRHFAARERTAFSNACWKENEFSHTLVFRRETPRFLIAIAAAYTLSPQKRISPILGPLYTIDNTQ